MRPDKKKVRHHDSRKKAAEAKRKAADREEKGKRPSQPEDAACGSRRQDLGEGEGATPASEFGKRNITSNWTKYEIPSSDDEAGGRLNSEGEEDPNTGESYADVLAGAGGSASLLREEEDQNRREIS